jgi:hypothetical protein
MVILRGVDESEGGGSALAHQDTLTGFLRQCTGKSVPVRETSETLLEQFHEFANVQGLAFLCQYLYGQVHKRLTSSPLPLRKSGLSLRYPSKLTDSTQLVVQLKFKDLEKHFLEILFFHEREPPEREWV